MLSAQDREGSGDCLDVSKILFLCQRSESPLVPLRTGRNETKTEMKMQSLLVQNL